MKINGRIKDPMTRQIDEDIWINSKDAKTLLNSKNDIHGPGIRKKS